MVRRRRRIKRRKLKWDPNLLTLYFKENLDPWALSLREWLLLLDDLERFVIHLCKLQGIPSEQIRDYIAYAKKQFKNLNKFTALTLLRELRIKIIEYLLRGLKDYKLQEIAYHVGQTLEAKKFLDTFKEYELLTDYLRVKFFITIPRTFTIDYRHILISEFIYTIIPPVLRIYANFLLYNFASKLPEKFLIQYSNFATYEPALTIPQDFKLNYSRIMNYSPTFEIPSASNFGYSNFVREELILEITK